MPRVSRRAAILATTAVLILATGIWARGKLDRPEPITILAAPELLDLRPVLAEFTRATEIRVELRAADGAPAARALDAVWLPAGPDGEAVGDRRLAAGRTIMSSPALLALKATVADRLGWTRGPVTWKQIAAAARGHRFTFGMSAPDTSFTGRAAVLAAATGLTGTIDSLSDRDIYPAAGGLRAIFTAQAVTAPSDTRLITAFLRTRGDSADGIFTYESQIARLNAAGRLRERLVPIRPSDGVVSARYTLRPMLNPRTPQTAERLARLTDFLLRADTQRKIAERIHGRPITPGVPLPAALRGSPLKLLNIPRDRTVADRLVAVYLGRYRYATRTVFVLDVSGSMRGTKIADLRRAATALARVPVTATSGIAADEQAVFLPFATTPAKPATINLSSARPSLDAVRRVLNRLEPAGETAAYDALVAAHRELARLGTDDRTISIVLITDGISNRGRTLSAYQKYRDTLPPALRAVPVYPVLVEGTDEPSMRKLADHTGGRLLDARQSGLATAFQTFRTQQ